MAALPERGSCEALLNRTEYLLGIVVILYDAMTNLKPKIVYPFNRQYSMSATKVCWVNSVACNLRYHIISTIEIYLVIDYVGRNAYHHIINFQFAPDIIVLTWSQVTLGQSCVLHEPYITAVLA